MFKLWDFQLDIVLRAKQAIKKYNSICIVMPTGSGKTAVSADISLRIYRDVGGEKAARGSVLYLVHRRELLKQTADTLDKIGLKGTHGFIAAGKFVKEWKPIQIASIPTLIKRLDYMKRSISPRVIFVDEGHHATAGTWSKIIKSWPKAKIIFLTATPARQDDKGLGDLIDHLILGPQIKQLTPEYLAPIRTYSVAPEFNMTSATLKAQSESLTGAVIANTVDNWKEFASDRKTIFFAVDLNHSQRIVEALKKDKITAAHMDYKTPPAERERIFKDLMEGRIQCISNMKLFTEGTDWPDCDCVVLARFTGSLVEYRQMNGRAMRRKSHGGDSIILDLAGNVYVHGMPDDDIDWELEYGYDKEAQKKKAILTTRCENCECIYSKKEDQCPICEHSPLKREVLEVDAEISLVDESQVKRKPMKRKTLNAEVIATGGDIGKLNELRKKHGYKHGWVERMLSVFNLR